MTKRRQEALVATATRGATVQERKIAQAKLNGSLAVRSEEQGDVWTGQGVLARNRNGARAYLRGVALQHFLNYTKDGREFTARTVPLSEDFGTCDFYVVLSWLLKNDLCIKNGSRYTIPNRAFVRATWNQFVDAMKL